MSGRKVLLRLLVDVHVWVVLEVGLVMEGVVRVAGGGVAVSRQGGGIAPERSTQT